MPTEAQRNGDFSALLSQGIVIYDPLTAVRRADGRIERQPFPNNVIPAGRISPIAREYLKYWPTANQAGTATGLNNYFSSNPRGDDFYSMNYRVDHVLTEKQRFFVRYSRNNRVENRGNWTDEVNGILPTGNFLYRINDAVNVDHVWRCRHVAAEHAGELVAVPGAQHPAAPGDLRSASLGFPSSATQYFGDNKYFPRFEFDDGSFSDLGRLVLRRHEREHLLVPADLDVDPRQPQLPVRRRSARIAKSRSRASTRPAATTLAAAAARSLPSSWTTRPAAAIGQDLAAMLLGYRAAASSTAAPIASTR